MRNSFKEYVIGIHGPRGAGKDAYGSYLACCYMLAGATCKSNMPIAATFSEGRVQSEELDISELYKFGQDFDKNVVIYLSEADKLLSARRSMTTANMLLNVLATQIGKKGITIIANTQDWFWLDDRWVYQTDIIVYCQDAAYTPWGREEELAEGYVTLVSVYNISGVLPGPQYKVSGQPFQQFRFNTRATWDRRVNPSAPIFDTYKILGVNELMRRVVLDRTELHIGSESRVNGEIMRGNIEDYVPRSSALDSIRQAIDGLRARGVTSIPGADLREILVNAGYQGDPRGVGNYIARIPGVRARRDNYRGVQYEIAPQEEGVLSGV